MERLKELGDSELATARELVYRATGIRMSDAKRTLLSNRLRRRMRNLGYDNFGKYLRFVQSVQGSGELTQFINAVTTNETFFLRTPEHFEWFGKELLQECASAAHRGLRERKLQVWSAACSSGEEPYSLALCLMENQLRLRDWDVQVTATDISQEMLERAQAGRFKQRALELLRPEQLRRYFSELPDEDLWEIKPAVRELVRFQRHNLLTPAPGGPYDCVFLRNVLIYFDADSKRRVINNISRVIDNGGYLVLGPSEGAWDLLGDFEKRRPWLFQKPPLEQQQ